MKHALHWSGGQSTRLRWEELDEDDSPGVVDTSRFIASRFTELDEDESPGDADTSRSVVSCFMVTGTMAADAASSLTVALFSSRRQYVTLASAMDSAVS